MSIQLRAARPGDAEVCGAICHDAFHSVAERHGFPPEFPKSEEPTGLFEHLKPRDDVYTVVSESDGRDVGSNVLREN